MIVITRLDYSWDSSRRVSDVASSYQYVHSNEDGMFDIQGLFGIGAIVIMTCRRVTVFVHFKHLLSQHTTGTTGGTGVHSNEDGMFDIQGLFGIGAIVIMTCRRVTVFVHFKHLLSQHTTGTTGGTGVGALPTFHWAVWILSPDRSSKYLQLPGHEGLRSC
jgi:hypothetical protein